MNFEDLASVAKALLEAAGDKNYVLVIALALVLVVSLVKRLGAQRIPALQTDIGAAALNILLGACGAVSTALLAGAPFTGALALTSLKVSFLAAGGYSLMKKLLLPLLAPLLEKVLPAKKSQLAVVKEAEQAGAKAAKGVDKSTFEELGK